MKEAADANELLTDLREQYRRLWLEANRPGGLEASIRARKY